MLKRKVGTAVVAVRRAGAIHVFDSINHLFLISQMIISPGPGTGTQAWALQKRMWSGEGRRGAGDHADPGTEHGLALEGDWRLEIGIKS